MDQFIDGEDQFDDEEEPMTAQKVSIFPNLLFRTSK